MKKFSLLLAFGLSFFCLTLVAQEEEFGLASYYSDDFQGRSTAYGVVYDKDELTCAHKRYPYGTMLKVTRLDNKKSVNVKVTDKGPFIKGRVVDLSQRAASILGIVGLDAVEVKVERVGAVSTRSADEEPVPVKNEAPLPNAFDDTASSRTATDELVEKTPAPAPKPAPVEKEAPAPAVAKTTSTAAPAKTTTPTTKPSNDRFSLVGKDYNTYGLYRMVLEKPKSQTGFGVQVASLTSYENVLQKVAELQSKWFDNILVSIEPGKGGNNAYKVILGPFDTQKGAQHYQESLVSRYKINGFVLDLASLKY